MVFGKLSNYEIVENKVVVKYENKNVYITILQDNIINFFASFHRKERNSKAVEEILNNAVEFKVELKNGELVISTEKLVVKVYDEFKIDIFKVSGELICEDYRGEREPFIRRAGNYSIAEAEGHKISKEHEYKVYVAKNMDDDMYFYGLGERTGSLNKKGYHYRNWNTDNPNPHGETFEQLYKSIPFMINIYNGESYGIFFDNHFETHFDMGKENSKYYYFASVDGNLDYYFIYGPTVKNVVKGYTKLTGRTPLPQKWTLGYQQCRWAYSPESRLMEVAKNFREKDIPCDTLYLDIEYMDGYRVYTWDKERFTNPSETLKLLKEMGFKVVTIIDPGVKVDKGYKIYDDGIENKYFATDKDGLVYKNVVWPGESVYPDFMNTKVRKWWADNQKIMFDTGVSGIWNDMNEPASFNGPLPDDIVFNEDGTEVTHKEIHNIYGHMMSRSTYEGIKNTTGKRPFVVTRACYAGTQKYSTIWTGDNQSTWEHLRMSLPMLMNLGVSGLAFCGTDVGGFGFDCTGELLSRWVQVGTFTPLFRNHSSVGTRDQEPWAFDEMTEEVNRKYIKLRYKLLPYLYDALYECENNGSPIIRPVLFNYQYDKNTYEINDEFMYGNNILVAPVVEQGARNRIVYLPKGEKWVDYWTGQIHCGGQYIIKETPIDVCPIYIKHGGVIPTYCEQNFIGEKINDELTLNIYLSDDETHSTYIHYYDDGESFEYRDGKYNEYEITIVNKEKIYIEMKVINKGIEEMYKKVNLNIVNANNKEIVFNNNI